MSRLRFAPVPGIEQLIALHADELPQKNELCGAFWGTLALRAAGITSVGAAPIDQDMVGMAAGSLLSDHQHDDLPYGETGRTDYRLAFAVGSDSTVSGTSAHGLVRALRELSDGRAGVIPVAGPWTPVAVSAVLDTAAACNGACTVIGNLLTGHLWGSRSSPSALLAYLMTGADDAGPAPDWHVGHFVGLLGRIEGPAGSLVIVADTYRSLGWQGIHAQPLPRVAAALDRSGTGHPSGVILVTPPADAPAVERRIRDAGLELGTWDNGSVDMAADAG